MAAVADERIVGREEELRRIATSVGDAAAGTATILLEGTAGIGKTTLWQAAVAAAQASGRRVLAARPAASEAAMPFAGLGDLLDTALDEVAGDLPEPQRRALDVALLRAEAEGAPPDARAIALGVLATVRALAVRSPVLVAVDDAQWLDRPTAAALEFALRRLGRLPVVALLAIRDEPGAVLPLTLERAERISLGPLSLGATHRLVQTHVGVVLPRPTLARLHEASGGNPFFAIEIARAVAAAGTEAGRDLPVPADLSGLVRGRLAALAPDAQEALAAIALLSEPTAEHVELLLGDAARADAAIASAQVAGILVGAAGRLRFAHPLFGAAAADRPEHRLRALHARLAGIVREPEQRARHLALASVEPSEDVAAALDTASARAAARGAPSAAADLAELAARLSPDGAAADDRLATAADHHFTAGARDRAERLYLDLLDRLPAGPRRAHVLLKLAFATNDLVRALAFCEQAVEQSAGDARVTAEAHQVSATIAQLRGDLDATLAHCRAALEHAEDAGDDAILVRAIADLALTEAFLGTAPYELLERGIDLERRNPSLPLVYGPSMVKGLCRYYDDALGESRALLEDVLERARRRDEEPAQTVCLAGLAQVALRSARWAEALAHAEELLDRAEQAAYLQWRTVGLSARARPRAFLGDLEGARADAEESLALAAQVGDEMYALHAHATLGLAALSTGDAVRAAQHLRDLPSRLSSQGYRHPGVLPVWGDVVEALVEAGELEAARGQAEAFAEQATNSQSPWAHAVSRRATALVAAAEGRLDDAEELLVDAAALHDGAASPFERARTLLVLGVVRRRLRRRGGARAALEEALALFEQLETPLWAAKARAEVGRLGGRVRVEGLTPTEERVAELVAEGRSNKEVAAALHVTVRTVESNLTRIYEKLGVRSRAELAGRFRSAG